MIDECLVPHVDLASLNRRRHRNDDRELLRVSLEIIHHRHDGAVAVPDEHDLRGLVEEFRVGLGDVEAAERAGRTRAE